MEQLLALYYSFWSNIIPYGSGYMDAYPDDMALDAQGKPAVPPYITYNPILGAYGQETMQSVRIWMNTNSTTTMGRYSEAVQEAIKDHPTSLILPDKSGGILMRRGNPFIQFQAVPDEVYANMKYAYINVIVKPFIL